MRRRGKQFRVCIHFGIILNKRLRTSKHANAFRLSRISFIFGLSSDFLTFVLNSLHVFSSRGSQEGKNSTDHGRLTLGKTEDLDIEEKILRRREMTHLFQWYYPEGGWGWVILVCAFLSQTLAHGLQYGFSYPLGLAIRYIIF